MHLRGRAQDDGVHFGQRQAVGQVGGDVADAVLGGDFLGFFQVAADQRDDFHAVDVLDAVQVFDAEGTGAGQGDFDGFAHFKLILQNQVAHGRVGCGHMVETVLDATGWRVQLRIRATVATSAIAPRAISHITSSMPSEPASRT